MILVDVYTTWHKGFVVNTDDPDKAAEAVQKAISDRLIKMPNDYDHQCLGFHPTEDYEVETYGEWDNTGPNPYEEIMAI